MEFIILIIVLGIVIWAGSRITDRKAQKMEDEIFQVILWDELDRYDGSDS